MRPAAMRAHRTDMTRDELLRRLRELKKIKNSAIEHMCADCLLLEYIDDTEIESAYDAALERK